MWLKIDCGRCERNHCKSVVLRRQCLIYFYFKDVVALGGSKLPMMWGWGKDMKEKMPSFFHEENILVD